MKPAPMTKTMAKAMTKAMTKTAPAQAPAEQTPWRRFLADYCESRLAIAAFIRGSRSVLPRGFARRLSIVIG